MAWPPCCSSCVGSSRPASLPASVALGPGNSSSGRLRERKPAYTQNSLFCLFPASSLFLLETALQCPSPSYCRRASQVAASRPSLPHCLIQCYLSSHRPLIWVRSSLLKQSPCPGGRSHAHELSPGLVLHAGAVGVGTCPDAQIWSVGRENVVLSPHTHTQVNPELF